MAILRALDGTFYEVPDDQVAKYKIPDDKVKEKLGVQAPTEGAPADAPPESGGPASPLVNVHIYYSGQGGPGGAPEAAAAEGAVQPYDWRNWRNWRNWNNWRNWRNHW